MGCNTDLVLCGRTREACCKADELGRVRKEALQTRESSTELGLLVCLHQRRDQDFLRTHTPTEGTFQRALLSDRPFPCCYIYSMS